MAAKKPDRVPENRQCALCGGNGPLRDSHLIPSALYALVRDPLGAAPDPLRITSRSTVQTSRQLKGHLLCGTCEDLFSKKGEKGVIAECLRNERDFRLRDLLRETTPDWSRGIDRWHAGHRIPGDRADKYFYFAASVFWRASVGRWPTARGLRGLLGSKYEKLFQAYLLGASPTIPDVLLAVLVANETNPLAVIGTPTSKSYGGYRVNKFQIPGIDFAMFVGGGVPDSISDIFRVLNTRMIFMSYNAKTSRTLLQMARLVRASPAKGKAGRIHR